MISGDRLRAIGLPSGRIGDMVRSKLAKTLAGSFVVATGARLVQLALAVFLARVLGPVGYGGFVFAVGAAMLLCQFCALGWPTLMNRLMPEFERDGALGQLRGLIYGGDLVLFGVSLLVTVVLVLLSQFGGFKADIATGLGFATFLLLPMVFTKLRMQQLAARGRATAGLMFDQGFGAGILLIALLLGFVHGLPGAMAVYGGASLLGVAISTFMLRRSVRPVYAGVRPEFRIRKWMGMATPMMVGNSAKLIMSKTDILMLAPLATMHETGLYGAGWRLSYMLSFPQVVLMAVMTPIISQALRANDLAKLRRTFVQCRTFTLVTTLLPGIVLVLFPTFVMTTVFGPEFAEGGPTLAVQTIAQIFASFSISQAVLLMMGGAEKKFGLWNIAVLLVHVVVNLALIPYFGELGAAYGTLVSSMMLCAIQFVLCRPILREGAK